MSQPHFDTLETRDPSARERSQLALLPDLLRRAKAHAPGWAQHLAGVEPGDAVPHRGDA